MTSEALERIALDTWKQPAGRVKRISPGVDVAAFAKKPRANALRVVKRDGEHWVGTLAAMQPREQLPKLVEAFKGLPEHWQLVMLGEGPAQADIRKAAAKFEIEHRVHLPGNLDDPGRVMGLFDIFALAAQDGRFPVSVVQAMAAGLAVAAPDTGEVRVTLSEENRPYLCAPNDAVALAKSLYQLAEDADARAELGAANRTKARSEFGEETMIERFRTLYGEIIGRGI